MITDLQIQHELLKTALEATDNYLFVEKRAKEAGFATNHMVHDFTYEMSRAHNALQALGVLDQHEDYMKFHADEMIKLRGAPTGSLGELPYSHVPMADVGEVEESKSNLSFKKFIGEAKKSEPKEDEETISDEEIQGIVDTLSWEDIEDMYNDDEFEDEEEDEEEEEDKEEDKLEEGLSASMRLKKRQTFARSKAKRNISKGLKLRRTSDPATLQKRAKLAARRALYRRFLKGRNKSQLSAAEKDRLENQVSRLKSIMSTLTQKMLPRIRSIEQKRLAHYRSGKK